MRSIHACQQTGRNRRKWLQVYNQDALELMHYSCSPRVIAVGTARLNARRLVRMLRQPIIGLTSRQMWDFGSNARVRTAVQCTACCLYMTLHICQAAIRQRTLAVSCITQLPSCFLTRSRQTALVHTYIPMSTWIGAPTVAARL